MLKIFFILVISRFSVECFPQNSNTMESDAEVCKTAVCQRVANSYSTSINASIDPCEDFYDFVCSGWKEANEIPEGYDAWNNFVAQKSKVFGQLHQTLENYQNAETEIQKKVGNFYKSCLNQKMRKSLGLEPLREILNKIGGWPLIGDKFDEDNYDWMNALVWIFRNTGISDIIFNLSTTRDRGIPTSDYFIRLKALVKSFSKIRRLNDNETLDIANRLGKSVASWSFNEEVKTVLQFEDHLGHMYRKYFVLDGFKKFCRTICEMQELFGDKVDMASYVQKVLEGIIEVTDETNIVMPTASPLRRLLWLLENTDKRVIANYIGWSVVKRLGYLVTKTFTKDTLQFGNETRQDNTLLQDICLTLTKSLLEQALGSIYVKEHFSLDKKKDITEMVKQVNSSFEDIIENSDWMDNETKKHAIRKLREMIAVIGYPETIGNHSRINEYYKTLGDVTEDDFFQNALNILQFHTRKKLMKLSRPTLADREITLEIASPMKPGASYNSFQNSFSHVNFATIGSIIGHEMTHGFDNEGRTRDHYGRFRNWWKAESEKKFVDKTKCFVQQYENYELTQETKTNVGRKLGEIISDNGGIRQSYIAWKKYVEERGDNNDKKLPLLDYTKEQLFFIAYAHTWCSNEHNRTPKEKTKEDKHPPDKFRVLGSLSNNRDFHNAFNCIEGYKMYREDICLLW